MNRYACSFAYVMVGLLSVLFAAPALAQGKTAAPLDPLNPLSQWGITSAPVQRGPELRPAPARPPVARADRRPEYQQKVTDRVWGVVTEPVTKPIEDGTLNRLSEWKPQMGAKLRTAKSVSDWTSDPLEKVLGKIPKIGSKANVVAGAIEASWPAEIGLEQGSNVPGRLYRDANRLDEELEGGEWAHTGFQQVLRMGRRPRQELEARRESLRREISRRENEERQEWAGEGESAWWMNEAIRMADQVLADPELPSDLRQFLSREVNGARDQARRLRERGVQPRRPQQAPDLQLAPQPTRPQPVQQQPPSEIKFVPRTPTPVLGAPGAGQGSGRGSGCKGAACRAD